MTRKIIIHIESDEISDPDALHLVYAVAAKGRISTTASRKHYCHVSTFQIPDTDDKITVFATKRTDTTDTFYVK